MYSYLYILFCKLMWHSIWFKDYFVILGTYVCSSFQVLFKSVQESECVVPTDFELSKFGSSRKNKRFFIFFFSLGLKKFDCVIVVIRVIWQTIDSTSIHFLHLFLFSWKYKVQTHQIRFWWILFFACWNKRTNEWFPSLAEDTHVIIMERT